MGSPCLARPWEKGDAASEAFGGHSTRGPSVRGCARGPSPLVHAGPMPFKGCTALGTLTLPRLPHTLPLLSEAPDGQDARPPAGRECGGPQRITCLCRRTSRAPRPGRWPPRRRHCVCARPPPSARPACPRRRPGRPADTGAGRGAGHAGGPRHGELRARGNRAHAQGGPELGAGRPWEGGAPQAGGRGPWGGATHGADEAQQPGPREGPVGDGRSCRGERGGLRGAGAVRLWLADGHPTRPRTRGAGCGSGGDHPPHLPRGRGRPGPRCMRMRAPHSAPRPWPSVWVLTAPRPLQYTERWPQPRHGCGRLTANDLAEKPPRRSARGGLTGRRRHRPGRRSS